MATKWKNNKKRILSSLAVSMAAALLFMSFFPLFTELAKKKYDNPLISEDFIHTLYTVNLAQYKYLREKADETQYSYCDLYFEEEISYEDENKFYTEGKILTSEPEKSLTDFRNELYRRLEEEQCYPEEHILSIIGETMDYYVEDLETGTVISNCGEELNQYLSPESPYVYYISAEYDAAGNIHNIKTQYQDDDKRFLNNAQSAGHYSVLYIPNAEMFFTDSRNQEGRIQFIENEKDGESHYATLHLKIKTPANMRFIYGMTAEQYSDLLYSHPDYYSFMNLQLALKMSYRNIGIGLVYCIFLCLCLLAGFLYRRKTCKVQAAFDMEEQNTKRKLCTEFLIALSVFLVIISDLLINMIYRYENGFLLKMEPLDTFVIFLTLAVLFLTAFILGQNWYGITWKELLRRSMICKWINRFILKIKAAWNRFYQNILEYDIGTDSKKIIMKILGVNFIILLIICCFWVIGIPGLILYTLIAYLILKKYVQNIQDKYQKLLAATSSIAHGNLDVALSEDFGLFESYKSELRQIQTDFKRAVEEEVKSQRMKTELITNVSHDLKTPLTAIITYIELLKKADITDKEREDYLDILQKKSDRLKVLIEDLFEISKASSKNVQLQLVDVDLCNLLRQVYLEHADQAEAAGLYFRFSIPKDKILIRLDSQKTYRIFDNLYTNIIKYAMPNTRVFVSLRKTDDTIDIELKNISAAELSLFPDELTERFVRGDDSRNTEGSGLGLAIAKSFTELQGGTFKIVLDGDLFKCILHFPGI